MLFIITDKTRLMKGYLEDYDFIITDNIFRRNLINDDTATSTGLSPSAICAGYLDEFKWGVAI
jgi:hypothetical protein